MHSPLISRMGKVRNIREIVEIEIEVLTKLMYNYFVKSIRLDPFAILIPLNMPLSIFCAVEY